jgi:GntR family transcriptional regulator
MAAPFSIERSANASIREQIIEQLRYLVASGHYRVGDTLPSTRKLGDELDVSFHTVRKAYQALVDEGLLESERGSGYRVKERTPLSKSERMERGAVVMREALQTLIGLGLKNVEIEYLLQEQSGLLEHASLERKLVLVGPYQELNELYAEQITSVLRHTVRPVPLDEVGRHKDADFVFAPYAHLSKAMRAVPQGDTMGFVTHLEASVLERVARLMNHETLGLVAQRSDTVAPLKEQLRTQTAFDGQIVSASIDQDTDRLQSFVEQTDWIVYTPSSRRRLLPLLGDEPPRTRLAPIVSQDSLDAIKEAVPA